MLLKVLSGGQTGADLGALDGAMKANFATGGTCPLGRKYEDGRIPDKYQLVESKSSSYPPRTAANIKDSDGTVIFTHGEPERGSALTIELCQKQKKPWLHIDLRPTDDSSVLACTRTENFVKENKIAVLNVAGNRESVSPGIQREVAGIIETVIWGLREQGEAAK